MKAIQIKKYGSNDVVEVNETASVPGISSGKILVNIKASGVNPVDWKIREGYMQQFMPLQLPSTLGLDFSGVVKQLDEDAHSDFKQGDEVYGQASIFSGDSGAFAELALAIKDSISYKAEGEVSEPTDMAGADTTGQQDALRSTFEYIHNTGSQVFQEYDLPRDPEFQERSRI